LDPDGTSTIDVRATNVLTRYYGELVLRLGQGWNVRTYCYDWRKDLDTAAEGLGELLKREFRGPVAVVAHSLGGMVARTLLRQRREAKAAAPFKQLVLLGTPNYGSFEVPQIFAGIQESVRKLVRLSGGVSGLFDDTAARDALLKIL